LTSRFKLLMISIACGILSLLPVLFVNNALNIAEITAEDDLGAPRIEVQVEDPCNSIKDVFMTVQVAPDLSHLDIESSAGDHPVPCKNLPYALITTSNLSLRTRDGRMVERDYSMGKGPTFAKEGTLERTAGNASSFAVSLMGNYSSDGRYRFAPHALKVGFGESAVQVHLSARNLTCSESNPAVQSGNEDTDAKKNCAIPLRAVLQYANAAFDVTAALPASYYMWAGPNIVGASPTSTEHYSTTRLAWAERVKVPSSVIKGTLTGFEIHLVDRRSLALRQFITVAGSAVFGAFISMFFSLLLEFKESSSLRTAGETARQLGAVRDEYLCSQKPLPESPSQELVVGTSKAVDQPPKLMASEQVISPLVEESGQDLAPKKPEPRDNGTSNLTSGASEKAPSSGADAKPDER
jgi:hypothetical protein